MALGGLKVLDFTWVAVGPITIKYLADNGATVVRVESVTRRDDLRGAPPCKDGISSINSSQFPAIYNTSKYGLGLNMSKPESQDLIRRLVKEWQPDVVAESFTPVVKKRWGLDYEDLKKIKEDIILFSACQQGQTGPKSAFAGFGMQAAAHAGFYHLTGWPDHGPLPPYGAYSDFINPPNGAAAILAALLYRDRTGKGQHIDLAQFECAIQYLSPLALDYQTTGRVMRRNGNADEAYAPHGIYPCASPENEPATPIRTGGHWCAIAVTSEEEWGALCEVDGDAGAEGRPQICVDGEAVGELCGPGRDNLGLDVGVRVTGADGDAARGGGPGGGGAKPVGAVERPSAGASWVLPDAGAHGVRAHALRWAAVPAIEDAG